MIGVVLILLKLNFGADWLSTKGNKIVDDKGNEVWLTGLNWFGYNQEGGNTLDGLCCCVLEDTLQAIADHGFNILRLPFSSQILWEWSQGNISEKPNFHTVLNPGLIGLNALELWDYTLEQIRKVGLKVLIDIHSAKTDSMGHMWPLWYNGVWTTERALAALKWIANRHKDDDTIVAYDIKNEPHGIPGDADGWAIWDNSTSANNYKHYCEEAANTIHGVNPNVLVLVEGIEVYPVDIKTNGDFHSKTDSDYLYAWWGGNLRGVADAPVKPTRENKVVYSPHDYGPAVFNQVWLRGNYTEQSVMDDYWYDSWFYIHDKNIAPLLIGEWGGKVEGNTTKWMEMLRDVISKNKIHHTFWCLNPTSGDTGGTVNGDWQTWDTAKYNIIKPALWQSGGKFVSLSHDTKLGASGLSLNDVYK